MKTRLIILSAVAVALASCTTSQDAMSLQSLKISENGHYLQYSDGEPFFYLGDTAWELFHRTTREEADLYLKDRAEKGYNVIQAVALSEVDGIDFRIHMAISL